MKSATAKLLYLRTTQSSQCQLLSYLPLVDLFREIRKALTNEINIVDEQKNFAAAREYYKGNNKVLVPEILPISTNHVTAMQFVAGEKITSAFKGDQKQRSIMAARLSNVMTGDVIFSKKLLCVLL